MANVSVDPKILHVTTAHRRRDVRIVAKECESLQQVFGDVGILVCDGEGAGITSSGIRITDLGRFKGPRPLKMARRGAAATRYILGAANTPRIVHFHDPEFLPWAFFLRLRGLSVIYDAHEDVPRQILSKLWIPRWFRRIVSAVVEVLENKIAARMMAIVAATHHIANRFQRIGCRTVEVNNYPMIGEILPAADRNRSTRSICYIGRISQSRGIVELVESLGHVDDVKLILCGTFINEDLLARVKRIPAWDKVDFRGQVDRAGVSAALRESVAGIVTLLPTPSYVDSMPVKMFEYMAAGLPVVASNFPAWREIVEKHDFGTCVDPRSPLELSSAIGMLLDAPEMAAKFGANGRRAVMETYNWDAEAEKLVELYESVLQQDLKEGVA